MIHSYVSRFEVCYHSVCFRNPSWLQTYCVAQAALKLMVILWPQLSKCQGHRHKP